MGSRGYFARFGDILIMIALKNIAVGIASIFIGFCFSFSVLHIVEALKAYSSILYGIPLLIAGVIGAVWSINRFSQSVKSKDLLWVLFLVGIVLVKFLK